MVMLYYEDRAIKTVDTVRNMLKGIDFAVTGSYAEHLMFPECSSFGIESDIDFAVTERNFSKARNRLLELSELLSSAENGLNAAFRTPDLAVIHLTGTLLSRNILKSAKWIDGVAYLRKTNEFVHRYIPMVIK
jgi:hypothetical protein